MPDRATTRLVLAIFVVQEVALVAAMVCGPAFQRLLELSPLRLGVLLSATQAGLLGTSLLVGHATHRLGARPVLLTGLGALAGGCALAATAAGFGVLLVALGTLGVGGALVSNANANVLTKAHPHGLRRIWALASALWFGSSALSGPAIGAWLETAQRHGWGAWGVRAPYLAALAGLLVLALVAARRVPAIPPAAREAPAEPPPSSRAWLWMPPLAFCHATMILGMLAWANPFLQATHGVGELAGGAGVGAMALGLSAGRLLLAARSPSVDDRLLLAGSALAGAAAFGTALAAPSYGVAVAGLGIGGFVVCCTGPCLLGLVGKRFPETSSALYGYLEASFALAGMVAPIAIGSLADGGLPVWSAAMVAPAAGAVLGAGALAWRATDPVGVVGAAPEAGSGAGA